MLDIELYDQLVKEIEELTYTIQEIREEIEKYLIAGNVFRGPSGMHGIDYSTEKVQGVGYTLALSDTIRKISEKEKMLQPALERLSILKSLKEKIDELHKNNCDTVPEKVFYLRCVKGYTQKMTAIELGYSERQIQRIEKKLKENYKKKV